MRATDKEKLFLYRQAFKLSQDEAARLVGVSKATWNRWERGHIEAPKSVMIVLELLSHLGKEERDRLVNRLLHKDDVV